jgi:hypothetical protein
MSSMAGSSAGLETFSTATPEPRCPVSRKAWSRSLPRLRALTASIPKDARPISQA